uniref:Otopetrin 3 n=1 Tax=Phasianus colchicus TaxID=9054 RepID=A0A669Q166_PHACC
MLWISSWLCAFCSVLQGEKERKPNQRDRQAQKSGQLFSGLLALNVVFLGSAFISSMIFNHVAITLADVWILLSILKVLCLCWIIYYLLGTSRQPHAVLYRDTHAGPVWIRGKSCFSSSSHAFLFPPSAWKIQKFFPSPFCSSRCGLMLTIATNLLLWLLAVTNDSIHMEIESQLPRYRMLTISLLIAAFLSLHPGNETDSCTCPNTTTCKVFQKGYILLYPFNTEYCLICCSVLYVMWKNVGRRISHHHIAHVKPKFKLQGVVFGPLLGAAAVIIGICVFMMYQIQATGSAPNYQVFVLYYSYYIVLLPLMCVVAVIGTIIHTLEKRELDTLKNPTRSLDVVLLMGAALGQIAMSYFSIVAIVATNPRDMLNSLILSYSVLLIFQYITQNIFIIDGLQRQPYVAAEAQHTTHAGQLSAEFRRVSLSYIHTYSHLSWKRKALKEISFFLVLCNIILWIMPTFGAHPVFENGLQKSFYGYSTWFAIVNFGLPLSVFYRMHSVGGLLEVYVSA